MHIKKYDEARKIYTCRIKGEDKAGDIEATVEEVTDSFSVNVRVLTEQNQLSGAIQVGINEKIVNLKEYLPI